MLLINGKYFLLALDKLLHCIVHCRRGSWPIEYWHGLCRAPSEESFNIPDYAQGHWGDNGPTCGRIRSRDPLLFREYHREYNNLIESE